MEQDLNILMQSELFAGLAEKDLREIVSRGMLREYEKGQFAVVPQQKVDSFGVVLTGKIHIMHISPEGGYSLMSVLGQGEILGADLICTRSRISPYHAVAAVPARVLYFPAELLTRPGVLEEACRVSMLEHLLTLISNENMKKVYRLAILSQKGLRERIVTYLTMQAARRQASTFAIPFSREELADFLCVNRSALSHELSLMQREGMITFRKNVFTIHNEPQQQKLPSDFF